MVLGKRHSDAFTPGEFGNQIRILIWPAQEADIRTLCVECDLLFLRRHLVQADVHLRKAYAEGGEKAEISAPRGPSSTDPVRPMSSGPRRPRPIARASSAACAVCARIARACLRNAAPAAVSSTRRLERLNKAVPSSRSRSRICWLREG